MERIERPIDHAALSPLSELDDYDIAEGSPDVRGWTVFDETGREIGEVADLLVDTATGEALYATVDLDEGDTIEVPLAAILLDEAAEGVRLTRPLDSAAVAHEAAFGSEDAGNLEDADRGEMTMERDEAMRATGPAGDRDLLEDIEENRRRGAENPGKPADYRPKS